MNRWEELVEDSDYEPPPERWNAFRARREPKDVTPNRDLLVIASQQRIAADRGNRAARAWGIRALIGLGVAVLPTPLMPFAFLFTVVAGIAAVCCWVAGTNAREGAVLAQYSATHPDD